MLYLSYRLLTVQQELIRRLLCKHCCISAINELRASMPLLGYNGRHSASGWLVFLLQLQALGNISNRRRLSEVYAKYKRCLMRGRFVL